MFFTKKKPTPSGVAPASPAERAAVQPYIEPYPLMDTASVLALWQEARVTPPMSIRIGDALAATLEATQEALVATRDALAATSAPKAPMGRKTGTKGRAVLSGFPAELRAALALFGKVIESKATIPILSCVRLDAEGDTLLLIGASLYNEETRQFDVGTVAQLDAA